MQPGPEGHLNGHHVTYIGMQKDFFKVFYHIWEWWLFWSCDLDQKYKKFLSPFAWRMLCLIWFCTKGPAPADDVPRRETENMPGGCI